MGPARLPRQKAIPFREVPVSGTRWPVLPRRQLDRVPIERIGPVRDLRPALPRTGREVPDLREWRRTTTLEQERQGNLLRVLGQQDDGSSGEVVAGWPVA